MLACSQFGGGCISGAELASHLLTVAVAHLPLCLWWGDGPVHSQLALLWYSHSPLFCEWPGSALELFAGKFSLSLFFSQAIPQFERIALKNVHYHM